MISNILKHYDYLILGAILLVYIFQVKRKAFETAKRKQVIIALKLCFYSSVILYVLQILSIFLNTTLSIDPLTITFWINLLVAGTVAIIDLALFRGNFIKQKRNRSQTINTRSKSPDWEFVELLSDDQKKSIIQYDFSKHQDSTIAKKIYYEYHTQIFYNFKFCKMDAHGIAIYQKQRTCALPGFVDSKNEEKTERNAGYLVVSHSGGGMLRQGTRKGIRRTPANRGMRAHWVVKGLDISEDVCHGLCP